MLARKYLCLLLIPLALGINAKFGYANNITQSLPYKHFLIVKNTKANKGDYILFVAPKTCQYVGMNLIKKIVGVSGEQVRVISQNVYVDENLVGRAKTHTKRGTAISTTKEMTIPANQYFVATDHIDSYDSRYDEFGLINEKDIIGVAYPLW